MKTIAISGKSGSGKSYIAHLLAKELSAEIINFDEVSHQSLMLENVKDFVRQTFGESVFDSNKNINRKELGKIAFSDPQKLEILNQLCEIEMVNIIDSQLNKSKSEYVILEYLLIPQMKYFKTANVKILVKASNETRKQRILKRDNISSDYYDKREQNSIDFNENDFDIIIQNDKSFDVKTIAEKIKADF